VKALLEDEKSRIQWIFVSDVVRATLLTWAQARGESTETLFRAVSVMAQPRPGGVHDDHIHVRTACSREELAAGCDAWGPERPWLAIPTPAPATDDEDLQAILSPLDAPQK
jgi:penicillin-insensitive murein DD-endopeptidase